jgi:RND family efflux transporter MFP subunit
VTGLKRARIPETFVGGVTLLLAAVGGVWAAGCDKTAAGGAGAAQAMPVQVVVAKSQKIPDTTEYLSVVKSRNASNINPQVEGYITKIMVKSGDRVPAGAMLLQIDPLKQEATVSSQEAARAAQEANVKYAQVNLERQKRLYEAGVTPKQDLDNAQTMYDAAVAQLKSIEDLVRQQRVELRYYSVVAPTAGVVGDIPVRVGDRVTVGTLLTTVNEPGGLEAYIYVPSDRARDLKMGMPVRLVDENGAGTDTRVTFVSPQVDPDTQTILVKAAVEAQGRLRISQQVRAQLTWGVHDGPVIPILAVTRINGQPFAFLAVSESKGTVARQKAVKLGEVIGNNFAVLGGMNAGDHIIVSGTQFLQDGAPVTEIVVQKTEGTQGPTIGKSGNGAATH